MDTATTKTRGSRRGRTNRIVASVCALALVAVVGGNVAAAPLERDNKPETPMWSNVSPLVAAKLRTKAGYEILAYL